MVPTFPRDTVYRGVAPIPFERPPPERTVEIVGPLPRRIVSRKQNVEALCRFRLNIKRFGDGFEDGAGASDYQGMGGGLSLCRRSGDKQPSVDRRGSLGGDLGGSRLYRFVSGDGVGLCRGRGVAVRPCRAFTAQMASGPSLAGCLRFRRNRTLPLAGSVVRAAYFAVPGQRAFVALARPCLFDGGRIFASAFSWCLAIIYLGSALSRLKLRAAEMRFRKAIRPDTVGGLPEAVFLGCVSVVGIQLLYIGSGYAWLPCSLLTGVSGALLVGLAPLMLAYAIASTLTLLSAAEQIA